MKAIVRKVKTLFRLLVGNSRSISAVRARVLINIRKLILWCHRKPFLYKTGFGFRFGCFPDSYTSRTLYIERNFEKVEICLVRSWLEENDAVLDIGANIGSYSIALAERIGKKGKVIAVEPSKKTACYIESLAKMMKMEQVHVEKCCVMNCVGYCDFLISHSGRADISQSLAAASRSEVDFIKERVPAATIDDIVRRYRIAGNVSLIKMDIEGAEPLALEKCSLINENKALPLVILEVFKRRLREMNFFPEDVYRYFPIERYDLFFINKSYPNTSCEFLLDRIYRMEGVKASDLPWHLNLIAVPRVGIFSDRRRKIQKFLD